MANFDSREFFAASEFNFPEKISDELISKLELARASAGVPFKITSDWREEGDGKSHHLGKAVDIRAKDSTTRAAIVRGATLAGIRRIGVYYATVEDGHHKGGHVHLDVNTVEDGFPQDVLWLGKSRR